MPLDITVIQINDKDLIECVDFLDYDTDYSQGYDKYNEPTSSSSASNRVHFSRSQDIFQKYLKFKVSVKTIMNLFNKKITTSKIVNAIGERDDNNSEKSENETIYKVTFEDTKNMEILGMNRNKIFNFQTMVQHIQCMK